MNGQWGQWTAWTACDKASCGHQSRERQCDSPAPEFKGDYCIGKANETQWCNTDPCEGIHNQVYSHVMLWFMVMAVMAPLTTLSNLMKCELSSISTSSTWRALINNILTTMHIILYYIDNND